MSIILSSEWNGYGPRQKNASQKRRGQPTQLPLARQLAAALSYADTRIKAAQVRSKSPGKSVTPESDFRILREERTGTCSGPVS